MKKKILIPVVAGVLIGCLVGLGLLFAEFYGADENFINYRP